MFSPMFRAGMVLGELPIPQSPPVVTGTGTVGQVLTTTLGTWTGSPTPTLTVQWQRLGTIWEDIAGATATTYTLVTDDGSKQVRSQITANNDIDTVLATSNAVAVSPIGNVAPVIGATVAQTKPIDTGTRYYNITSITTGTQPITYHVVAKVISCSILDNADGTYTAQGLFAGYPNPTLTYVWELDGTPVGGQTAATIDAETLGLSGDLTVVTTATNTHGSGALESSIEAVDYGTVTPVLLGVNTAGNSSASNTYDITIPAYSTGDLVVLLGSKDSGTVDKGMTITTTAGASTGPNGETLTEWQAHEDNGDTAAGGTSIRGYRYIATANQAAAAMRITIPANSDEIKAVAFVVDAGTFNSTTPMQVAAATKNATASNPVSVAFTATNAGGLIGYIAATDNGVDITATPSGWTQRGVDNTGAPAISFGTRNAFATASESVAAATWTMATSDGWIGVTFVINPGP